MTRHAVSFIEVMTIVAIIAVLAAIVAPHMTTSRTVVQASTAPAEQAPPDTSPSVKKVEYDQYDVGQPAEMRAWKFNDGSRWMVIGRGEHFVVFTSAGGGAWTLAAQAGDLPIVVQQAVKP